MRRPKVTLDALCEADQVLLHNSVFGACCIIKILASNGLCTWNSGPVTEAALKMTTELFAETHKMDPTLNA